MGARLRSGATALVVALLLGACGGPVRASLEDLVFDTDSYVGRDVTVSGTVVEFDESDGALQRHIVIEDVRNNRVQLEPIDVAEPFVGSLVEVTGGFRFDPTVGRILDVSEIAELTGSSDR
jgi:hypothetical protein